MLFMPVYIQPFKMGAQASDGAHRLAMLKLAIEGEPAMGTTDVELSAKGVSYTINSLRAIRDQYPKGSVLSFVLGSDMFMMLEKWYKSKELLKEFSFIVASRPGCGDELLERQIETLGERYGASITRLSNEQVDLSSTEIREALKRDMLPEGQIPAAVEKYIYENGIYRQ
jgi:nicotinate-nucleotide adenylyltransferase